MRTNKEDERAFTVEIGKLRVLSTELRKEEHDKFINWIDVNPMRDGSVSQVLTIVLPTRGCKFALAWHGGCTMCSLPSDNPRNPSESFVKSFAERCLTICNR